MLRPCYLTQKQEEMFHRYCNSSATSLCDVYGSWSDAKEQAFKYCLRDMKEHDGYDMRITGANYYLFSCAYRIIRDDGAYLVYHTPTHRFEFKYMENTKMTKQEQIAEMEKIIKAEYKQWLDVTGVIPEGTTYYAECLGCAIDSAETLYNVAGYRKTFTSDLARDMQNAFKEGYEKGCETCEQAWDNGYNDGYESGKEDGVKEFAEKLKEKSYVNDYCHEVVEVEKIDQMIKEYDK